LISRFPLFQCSEPGHLDSNASAHVRWQGSNVLLCTHQFFSLLDDSYDYF